MENQDQNQNQNQPESWDVEGAKVQGQTSGKPGFEGADDRHARMIKLLSESGPFVAIGKLMSRSVNGKTIAQSVLDGETVALPGVINGLTVKAGQELSLASIDSWGCPACGSQHGTGVRPSPRRNAKSLAEVQFYTDAKSGIVFSVSDSCWGTYVKGNDKAKRFISKEEFAKLTAKKGAKN